MTSSETELRLRLSLEAHAYDLGGTEPDPWVRVTRAHRRSQLRRRRVAAVALAVLVVIGGGTAGAHRWAASSSQNPPPAEKSPPGTDTGWLKLDDGRPRGSLGPDPQLRRDVLAALQSSPPTGPIGGRLADPDTVRVLWADVRGGRRLALVRAAIISAVPAGQVAVPTEIWVGQPSAGASMTILSESTSGPAISTIRYTDATAGDRYLAVVRRDAQVMMKRTVIDPDGTLVHRVQGPLPVLAGVVDVPLDPQFILGQVTLTASAGGDTAATSIADLGTEGLGRTAPDPGLTPAQRTSAGHGARGPGIPPRLDQGIDVRPGGIDGAVGAVMYQFDSPFATLNPQVVWAGPVSAARGGGTVTAIAAGLPGQGRLLEITHWAPKGYRLWRYQTTVPAKSLPGAAIWRVHTPWGVTKPTGEAVGWLVGPQATSVKVTVNGRVTPVTTQDGLGWITVPKDAEVTVTVNGLPGGRLVKVLHPADVEPNLPPQATLLQPGR
jgi:hypothetical protein